jgi:hypothetical protein
MKTDNDKKDQNTSLRGMRDQTPRRPPLVYIIPDFIVELVLIHSLVVENSSASFFPDVPYCVDYFLGELLTMQVSLGSFVDHGLPPCFEPAVVAR